VVAVAWSGSAIGYDSGLLDMGPTLGSIWAKRPPMLCAMEVMAKMTVPPLHRPLAAREGRAAHPARTGRLAGPQPIRYVSFIIIFYVSFL
jgi:hypothetical protein